MPTQVAYPLFLTADQELLDSMLRALVAADRSAEIAGAAGHVSRPGWMSAPLVVVGADIAEDLLHRGLPRRSGIVVAVRPGIGDATTKAVDSLGAERIVMSRAGEEWLANRLAAVR